MSKIKKLFKSHYFPFVLLFIIMLILTAGKKFFHDDSDLFSHFSENPMMFWVRNRYLYWTSRIIIEVILGLFASRVRWLWKITDPIMYVLLGFAIYRVFVTKHNNKTMIWLIVCLVLLIPQKLLSEAGWMATSLNYLWPVAFGVFSLIPIRKTLDGEKIRWFEVPFYAISLIFAENMEQVAAVLFTVYLLFTIYFVAKRKLNFTIVIMLLLSIASVVFILKCPGNSARADAEVANWFVDYPMYNKIDQAFIGLYSTMQYFINHFNPIYLVFTLSLMITIFKRYNNIAYRAISIIPFFMGIAFNIGEHLTFYLFAGLHSAFSCFQTENRIYLDVDNLTQVSTYIPVFCSIVTLACFVVSVYLVFREKHKAVIPLLILCAGICSKFIMGFIVTVFASSNRTSFIFMICMLILSVMILDQTSEKTLKKCLNILIIWTIFTVINHFCICTGYMLS